MFRSFDKKPDLIILVIKSSINKGQGGIIGQSKQTIILISSNARKGTIKHEFAHSFFMLGDEYGGDISFPPSAKEIRPFKNLSLTKDKKEWLYIKEISNDPKIDFYEGGLGRKKGVYHGYPECLMQNLDNELCPICVFYAIEKLNKDTKDNEDFLSDLIQ